MGRAQRRNGRTGGRANVRAVRAGALPTPPARCLKRKGIALRGARFGRARGLRFGDAPARNMATTLTPSRCAVSMTRCACASPRRNSAFSTVNDEFPRRIVVVEQDDLVQARSVPS